MEIALSWYLPGRIIYTPGTTDKTVIAERNARILELLEREGKPPMVHTFIDHTNQYTPEQLQAQSKSMGYYVNLDNDDIRQKLHRHPLLGWVISIATPNVAMKMAGSVSSQQHQYRWHSVSTMEEAITFLKQRDSTLHNLQLPARR